MEHRKSHIHRNLGVFGPTLEEVSALTSLSMFDDTHATWIIFDVGEKEKSKFLNKAYSESKTSTKAPLPHG